MISPSVIQARYRRLEKAMQTAELPVLALNPGQSLIYFSGLPFHLMERPVLAFFIPGAPLIWVIPVLEQVKLDGFPLPVKLFTYGDDPATWPQLRCLDSPHP